MVFSGLRENMVRVGVGVGVSTSIPGILNGVYFSWSLYSTSKYNILAAEQKSGT